VPHALEDVDYADWLNGSLESARIAAPLVVEAVAPSSVVDVGCGLGAWLVAFQAAGVHDVVGVDGPWVDTERLLIPRDRFVVADLRAPVDLGRRFDLALCLEVAQILAPEEAGVLVATLAGLADVVVFSAAVPGQGGIEHRNEQWPAYWAERFAAVGFAASDPFRVPLWQEPDVKWWFAQNLLCVARPEALARHPVVARAACPEGGPLPLVHPGCLAEANARAARPMTMPAGPGRLSRAFRRSGR
jgi:SAM-dependent methyltransferase